MKRNRITAVLAVAVGALGLPAAAQASAYSDGVLATNPLMYLPLDEASGATVAQDASPNNRDGAYAGDFTLGAAGPFTEAGTSVKLGKTGKTGKITADVPGPSGSVELWVNPDRMVKNPDVPLVAHGDPTGDGWALGVGNRRKLAWRSGSKQVPTQVRLSNGVWTALTVTWDGSKVRFYRNGALAKTVNGVVTPASSSGKLVIGGDGNVFRNAYTGQVDEVAVYRQVLSASDVAAHQAATHVPVNTSLPQVTGVASVGSALSVLRGTWSNGGVSPIYKYQWQRCDSDGEQCADVPGATTSTYRLVDGDSCSIFQVVETVINGNGQSASAVSNRTEAVEPCGVDAPAPENEQPPVIDDDTPAVDQSLTVARGIWSFIDDSTQFEHVWQRCDGDTDTCVSVSTGDTYQVRAEDACKTLQVVETVVGQQATSERTKVVAPCDNPGDGTGTGGGGTGTGTGTDTGTGTGTTAGPGVQPATCLKLLPDRKQAKVRGLGTLRLKAAAGTCVKRALPALFKARKGLKVKSVRYKLDGKRLAGVKRPRFGARLKPSKLRAGKHKLTVRVTPRAGKAKAATLRLRVAAS